MNSEQQSLDKWRELPTDKQQKVLQFVESLTLNKQKQSDKTALGQRLRQIRAKIVANSESLLNREQIEQEVINRRGELQEIDK